MNRTIFVVETVDEIDPKQLSKEIKEYVGVETVKTIEMPPGTKFHLKLD